MKALTSEKTQKSACFKQISRLQTRMRAKASQAADAILLKNAENKGTEAKRHAIIKMRNSSTTVSNSSIYACEKKRKNRMNIKDILREYKRQHNVNNDRIAKELGVSASTVSRWASGQIRKVQPETLEKLANLVGIDPEEMERVTRFTYEKPLLGTVKAGYGLLAEENLSGYVPVSEKDYHRGDYFLRVEGNSMKDARIHSQDLLYVRSCGDVPSGAIAVILIGGEEVTVKKLFKKKNCWILQAANSRVEPRVFTLEEVAELPVQVIGKAVYAITELS